MVSSEEFRDKGGSFKSSFMNQILNSCDLQRLFTVKTSLWRLSGLTSKNQREASSKAASQQRGTDTSRQEQTLSLTSPHPPERDKSICWHRDQRTRARTQKAFSPEPRWLLGQRTRGRSDWTSRPGGSDAAVERSRRRRADPRGHMGLEGLKT